MPRAQPGIIPQKPRDGAAVVVPQGRADLKIGHYTSSAGLGGEGYNFGFGAGLFGWSGQFMFGAQPILHGVAGGSAAFEVDFVGAGGDLILRGSGFCGGFLGFGRWGFFRLRHTSLLPRATVLFYAEPKCVRMG